MNKLAYLALKRLVAYIKKNGVDYPVAPADIKRVEDWIKHEAEEYKIN